VGASELELCLQSMSYRRSTTGERLLINVSMTSLFARAQRDNVGQEIGASPLVSVRDAVIRHIKPPVIPLRKGGVKMPVRMQVQPHEVLVSRPFKCELDSFLIFTTPFAHILAAVLLTS
jgi:hypothetical protein